MSGKLPQSCLVAGVGWKRWKLRLLEAEHALMQENTSESKAVVQALLTEHLLLDLSVWLQGPSSTLALQDLLSSLTNIQRMATYKRGWNSWRSLEIRGKKGHQPESWSVTVAQIFSHGLLKSLLPWSPSVQRSERGNNAVSIKHLGMVWTKARETLVHSHTWFCI